MRKYKVEFIQKEVFVVDVLAKNEAEAKKKAGEKWEEIAKNGIYHYYSMDEPTVEFGTVYDVTGTDDPFNP